jgi:hypothetical protein
MKTIEVIIDNEGQTTIEAKGYKGAGCMKATAPLSKALIGTPTSHVKLPTYYQADHTLQIKETE